MFDWCYAPYMSLPPKSREDLRNRKASMQHAKQEYIMYCHEAQENGRLSNGITFGHMAIYMVLLQKGALTTRYNEIEATLS